MNENFLTLHPQGKNGVNISKDKYNVMKAAIVNVLQKQGEMTFRALNDEVRRQLEGNFAGSIGWYVTTVKLDLEARGVIERFGKSPQQLRLTANE